MIEQPCPTCGGKRLRPESLSVLLHGKSIGDVVDLPVTDALQFFESIPLRGNGRTAGGLDPEIARPILKEVNDRLRFLSNVGLEYLTLGRSADSLSGGEAQRIRLATQIGSRLVGVLYILDEPSIGLHQRDNARLLATLKELRDIGNTVLVVEHDEETIRSADHVVDLGPRAGRHGGEVVIEGPVKAVLDHADSLTGRYLRGELRIPVTPGDVHGAVHADPRAVHLPARIQDPRLRARAVFLQREGRAVRGVPGRRPGEGRDALSPRRVRPLRGVQGATLQPGDARGAL